MSLCPWTSCQEWDDVYLWLYSPNTDMRRKGVGRVAAWKARGAVPALLEVTADMVACLVHEEDCSRHLDISGQAVSLMYAMALTRFVNGAFDVCYVTNPGFGRNIKSVVGEFGIPPYIVSLRHECSHKTIPSLGALKCAIDTSLRWLQEYYWEPQRQLNGLRGESTVTIRVSGSERKTKKPVAKLRETLSQISSMDFAQELLLGKMLNFPTAEYKVVVPLLSDLKSLPNLTVSSQSVQHWWQAVFDAKQKRPELETVIMNGMIIAMHSPECSHRRRDFLAALLDNFLKDEETIPITKKLNHDAVDWLSVFTTLEKNPGYYSEALLNIMLPFASNQLQQDVLKRTKELATLVTLSERFSRYAYARPLSSSSRDHLGDLVKTVQETRNEGTHARGDDESSELEQEAPPSKRARLSKSTWSIAEAPQKWVECQLGLCPGQSVSSTFLDLNYAGQSVKPSSLTTVNPTSTMDGELQPKNTFSVNDVTRIQRNVQKFTLPDSGTSCQPRHIR